jgi:hypothetical protein
MENAGEYKSGEMERDIPSLLMFLASRAEKSA